MLGFSPLSTTPLASIFSAEVIIPPAIVPLPTIGIPTTDTTIGTWVSTAGSLSAAINETVPDDTSYISTSSASMCEVALNETAFPGTSNQVLSYRMASTAGSTITITLNQGATLIASWSHSLTSTPTTYRKSLTAGERALIVAGPISVTLAAS